MSIKMGLYVQRTDEPKVRQWLLRLRPSVVVMHLGGDLGGWIKANLPDTYLVGRRYWSDAEQEALLTASAEDLVADMMHQHGASYCDGLMLFNEFLASPKDNGWETGKRPDRLTDSQNAYLQRTKLYDSLQVAVASRLEAQHKDLVYFNFGAGSWADINYYQEWQPKSLSAMKVGGLHVYGWPRLANADWRSNWVAAETLVKQHNRRWVLTEVAVTRAYGQPGHPDEGWLSEGDGAPISEADYFSDLDRINTAMQRLPNLIGGALFNAAGDARWTSFAVTDGLVDRMANWMKAEGEIQPLVPDTFGMPLAGNPRLTQWYGENPQNYPPYAHEGLDWGVPIGTEVLAAAGGKVTLLPVSPVYGTYVRLLHEGSFRSQDERRLIKNGKWQTVYAHLSQLRVREGQIVSKGEVLGLTGNSGRSTGPHLHFGLRMPDQNPNGPYWGYTDPAPWLGLSRVAAPGPELLRKAAFAKLRQDLLALQTDLDALEKML